MPISWWNAIFDAWEAWGEGVLLGIGLVAIAGGVMFLCVVVYLGFFAEGAPW